MSEGSLRRRWFEIGDIRIFGIFGLELACNRGSCGVPVQFREYKCGLFDISLIPSLLLYRGPI